MIAKRAERIEKKAKAKRSIVAGVIPWALILPTLMELLGKLCIPKTPVPPIPIPEPTPEQTAAWEDAHSLKSGAVDNWDGNSYRPAAVNKTAAKVRRSSKRNGDPITKAEGHESALLIMDDARTSTMVELYHDVLEARHTG